jgi:ketosteroid isomerase-like protein
VGQHRHNQSRADVTGRPGFCLREQCRTAGATIDTAAGWVAQFRDGLIAGFRTYTDRHEALKAVGLSE